MLYIMESMLYYSVAMNENIESVQTPPSVPRGIPKWIPRLGILAAIATILSRRWLPQHADADMMLRTLVALAPIPIWLAWAWATQRRISLLDEMERLMIYEGWFFAGIGTLFVLMGAAQLDLAGASLPSWLNYSLSHQGMFFVICILALLGFLRSKRRLQ